MQLILSENYVIIICGCRIQYDHFVEYQRFKIHKFTECHCHPSLQDWFTVPCTNVSECHPNLLNVTRCKQMQAEKIWKRKYTDLRDFSLNCIILLSQPIGVVELSNHISSACARTWDCTKTDACVHKFEKLLVKLKHRALKKTLQRMLLVLYLRDINAACQVNSCCILCCFG